MTMEAGRQMLSEVAERIKNERGKGAAPTKCTPTTRQFLSWFGVERRGAYIRQQIRHALNENGLRTEPAFEQSWIDSPISILDSVEVSPVVTESTLRIDSLKAANLPPQRVTPNDPLGKATTLMQFNDYSQLPVMTNDRTVKGVISWKSIGVSLSSGQRIDEVRHCMIDCQTIGGRESLFKAVSIIAEHDYVLVRNESDGTIGGIVTASDLTHQLQQLSEPFLLVGETEIHLRTIIGGRFTPAEIQKARHSPDDASSDEGIEDLTLGEYGRLLEPDQNWSKLNLNVDRTVFLEQLNDVRKIRNEVMHFNPDEVNEEELAKLRLVSAFIQRLAHAQAVGT